MRRLIAVLALVAATVLPATASAAGSSVYSKMFNEYSSTGTIAPCQFTVAQLNSVLKSIDLYQQAYSADFPNAIERALADRASGYCSSYAPVGSASVGGTGGGPVKLGPVTAATGAPVPAPLLILAALAGVLALLGAGAAVFRARGFEPGWGPAARQSLGEAGYRLAGALENVSDRLRRRGGPRPGS